jgi:hypothetical protein
MLSAERIRDLRTGNHGARLWQANGIPWSRLTQPLLETETLSLLRERKRLGHLQHGMMVLFVGELTRNPPSLTRIELYRDQVRLNDAKAARLATASNYLGFTLCEQSPSDTLSPVLLKHPKVINPLLVRYYHPENLGIRGGYPCQRPILVFELQGDRIRSENVLKRLSRYDLYEVSY